MNVTLPSELERHIQASIARGDYETPEALVGEAVRRLIGADEADLDALREILRTRNADIERGDAIEFDQRTTSNLASDISSRGQRRLAELNPTDTPG